MLRGEIWWTDLGPPAGSAPAYRRPVLVVSSDRFNRSAIGTVTVVALTSNARLGSLPGNLLLQPRLSGLPRESVVNVSQVATIGKTALQARVGRLPEGIMAEVDDGLRLALQL